MAVVTILSGAEQTEEEARAFCGRLEAGDILYFPVTPVPLASDDIRFLLGQQQADSSLHKNIAYKPNADRLSGFDAKTASPAAVERLHGIMRGYSGSVVQFLARFLAPYRSSWKLDYASFRPLRKKRVATCRSAAATTCCIPTPFRRGPRMGRASCGSSITFTRRVRATGLSAIHSMRLFANLSRAILRPGRARPSPAWGRPQGAPLASVRRCLLLSARRTTIS